MRRWIIGRTEADYFEKVQRNRSIAANRAAQFRRALREKQQVFFDEAFRTAPGETRHFVHSFFPVFGSDGTIESVLGFRYDITEQKHAEAALAESLARLQAIFDGAGDAIMTIGEDGKAESVNLAALRLLGYTAEEIQTCKIDQLLSPCNGGTEWWWGSEKGPHSPPESHNEEGEFCAHRKDGSSFFVDLTVSDLVLNDRHLRTVVFRDVSERKRHESSLRLYSDRLVALREIDHAILTAQSAADVAQVAAQRLVSMIPASKVCVHIKDEDGRIVRTVSVLKDGTTTQTPGPSDEWLPERINDAVSSKTTTRREAPRIDRTAADPDRSASYAESRIDIPLRSPDSFVGVLCIEGVEEEGFGTQDLDTARDVAGLLSIALHNARLFEEVDASRSRLQALSRRLVQVQEEERRHLARELHDEIGQTLTGLKLALESARRKRGADRDQSLDEAAGAARRVLGRVRDISLDLRPAMLDDLGLLAALLWLVDRYERQTEIRVDFKHSIDREVEPDVATAAFRIIQEALTNVARHSGAEETVLLASVAGAMLIVSIRDNGKGFNVATDVSYDSSGLSGMQERVELLRGELVIQSEPGHGTVVTASIPIGA
jgi:PAS domain S-box-containing protein